MSDWIPKPSHTQVQGKVLVKTWGGVKLVPQVTMVFNTDSWSSMTWGVAAEDMGSETMGQRMRPWQHEMLLNRGEPW